MNSKKIIQQLIKIAEKQQRIIEKLAQLPPDSLPTSQVSMTDSKTKPPADPAPQHLRPNIVNKNLAAAIIAKLPANVKNLLTKNWIEVHGHDVIAWAKPEVTDKQLDIIEAVIEKIIPQVCPPGQYHVKVIS
jgi:hypothetical protein